MRMILLIILVLFSSGGAVRAQQAASSAKATPTATLTPIPLDKVSLEEQSALASVQEIEANVVADQSSADAIARTVSVLTSEIDARFNDDTGFLTTRASLDAYSRLYELNRLKLVWQNLSESLSASALQLTRDATGLEKQIALLDQLNATWQATFQSAKQHNTPAALLQSVQSLLGSIARTRQAAKSGQERVLTLQGEIASEQARVRAALSSPSVESIRRSDSAECARQIADSANNPGR